MCNPLTYATPFVGLWYHSMNPWYKLHCELTILNGAYGQFRRLLFPKAFSMKSFFKFFFSLLGEINAIQPLWDLLLYLKINSNLARSVRTGDKNGAAIIGFTLEVEKSISSYSALISCII